MSPSEQAFFGSLAVAWVAFFLAGVPIIQRRQARKYVAQSGGKVIELKWQPFVSLVHEKNTRRWSVKFEDAAGKRFTGILQTSLFTGIKWVKPPVADDSIAVGAAAPR